MNTNSRDQAQSLRELVERTAAPQRDAGRTKFVAVASGKGGVGKSIICVNLALALSNMGYRVLVVDADFGLANIDIMLGVTARYNLGHLLRKERSLQEIIQQGHGGVRFISGGSGVFELLQMEDSGLRTILRDLRGLSSPADIVLFDAGAGINDHVIQLINSATDTVIVTTPEPTAILDAYALVKTIVKSSEQSSLRLIMNKCDTRREGQMAVDGFSQVIRKHLARDIRPLGCILYDHEVINSIKSQTPVMLSHPRSLTSRDINTIAQTLMDIPVEQSGPGKRLARLFERLLG